MERYTSSNKINSPHIERRYHKARHGMVGQHPSLGNLIDNSETVVGRLFKPKPQNNLYKKTQITKIIHNDGSADKQMRQVKVVGMGERRSRLNIQEKKKNRFSEIQQQQHYMNTIQRSGSTIGRTGSIILGTTGSVIIRTPSQLSSVSNVPSPRSSSNLKGTTSQPSTAPNVTPLSPGGTTVSDNVRPKPSLSPRYSSSHIQATPDQHDSFTKKNNKSGSRKFFKNRKKNKNVIEIETQEIIPDTANELNTTIENQPDTTAYGGGFMSRWSTSCCRTE